LKQILQKCEKGQVFGKDKNKFLYSRMRLRVRSQ